MNNIKEINPVDILGLKIKHRGKNYYLCYAPYREDKKASFSVYLNRKNEWKMKDHATGWSGDIINYVIEVLQAAKNYTEALDYLSNITFFPFTSKTKTHEREKTVYSVNKSFPRFLMDYLLSRGIKFIPKEFLFLKTSKIKAVAIFNDADGIEFRNKHIKGSLFTKSIRSIDNGSDKTYIVEGMFDYASVYQKYRSRVNYIILNSVSNTNKVTKSHRLVKGKKVVLMLDNDEAGKSATTTIQNEIVDAVSDLTVYEYPCNCKDPNDVLLHFLH